MHRPLNVCIPGAEEICTSHLSLPLVNKDSKFAKKSAPATHLSISLAGMVMYYHSDRKHGYQVYQCHQAEQILTVTVKPRTDDPIRKT